MARGATRIQVENDRVRIAQWTFAANQETGTHRHEFDYVVVPLGGGEFEIADAQGGTPARYDMRAGESYYRPSGAEHNITFLGPGEASFVEIELLE